MGKVGLAVPKAQARRLEGKAPAKALANGVAEAKRPPDTHGPAKKASNALNGVSAHQATHRSNGLGAAIVVGEAHQRPLTKPKVLVIDIGGTNVKLKAPGHDELKFPSGKEMTPQEMVAQIQQVTKKWAFDVIAIGYPGVVKDDHVTTEPANLGKGWVGFDFGRALGKPVKMVNDAAMQALGSCTKPGLTLFMGVGTGLGVALVLAEKRADGGLDKRVLPTELGHAHATRKKDYEALVNKAALSNEGRKEWTKALKATVGEFKKFFNPDEIVIGGGNVKKLKDFRATFPDESIVAGNNDFAFEGGEAMWER